MLCLMQFWEASWKRNAIVICRLMTWRLTRLDRPEGWELGNICGWPMIVVTVGRPMATSPDRWLRQCWLAIAVNKSMDMWPRSWRATRIWSVLELLPVGVAKAEVWILLEAAIRAALPIDSMDDGPISSTLLHVSWLNMRSESITVKCEDLAIENIAKYLRHVLRRTAAAVRAAHRNRPRYTTQFFFGDFNKLI